MNTDRPSLIRGPHPVVTALSGAAGALVFMVGAIMMSASAEPSNAASSHDVSGPPQDPSNMILTANMSEPASADHVSDLDLARAQGLVDRAVSQRESVSGLAYVEDIGPAPESRAITARAGDGRAEREAQLVSGSSNQAFTATSSGAPRLVIVLDDIGLDRTRAERAIALDAPVTLAVLPYATAAPEIAEMAREAGQDVIIHMPMEPLGLEDPGPHALRLGLSAEELSARVQWAIQRVPGASGLNNHMGSRFTRDAGALRRALLPLVNHDMYFLDSVTIADSRAGAVADGLGLPVLRRHVFLDNVQTETAIRERLDDAEALARRDGLAVMIGHPHTVTLDVLETWIDEARERGFEFVTARTAVDTPDPEPSWLNAALAE
ncbi:divergent polysaccharide deacetylase family protein [Maricaulis sp. D1M11]|uniref:divergent polysaccharide deacetylase family protein n=1 Tax=Maricaulis sp. D1M11 TaxID=3076117 RepID=UPI0039B5CB17